MTWEERRALVEREAKKATAATAAALSTVQTTANHGPVALPVAPRLAAGSAMREREERAGIVFDGEGAGVGDGDGGVQHARGREGDGVGATATRRSLSDPTATVMDWGADDGASSDGKSRGDRGDGGDGGDGRDGRDGRDGGRVLMGPAWRGDGGVGGGAWDGHAEMQDDGDESEFEEAFEACMAEDYTTMTRQELIARLQQKDHQLATLEARLTQLQHNGSQQ